MLIDVCDYCNIHHHGVIIFMCDVKKAFTLGDVLLPYIPLKTFCLLANVAVKFTVTKFNAIMCVMTAVCANSVMS